MKKYFFEKIENSVFTVSFTNKKNIYRRISLIILIFFLSIILSFVSSDSFAQGVTFSYSYFNITRNTAGGTLEKGDIIEIHALAYVPTGTTISNFYFTDSIRTGTQYVPSSMKILTNEGVKV